MVDMHCPANVTLIAGGVEPGHANGYGRKAKFRNPAGVVTIKEQLYVCDQENGRVRVVNTRSLFCHASQISQENEDSENENEECAVRRVHKVDVHDLTLISETNVPSLESPFAICASTKDQFQLFVFDFRLNKFFSISNVLQDEETGFFGSLKEVLTFERSSVLTALALTRDELYMLVGDCDING